MMDDFEMPSSMETSNFLKAAGKYELVVTSVVVNPPDKSQQPMDGIKFLCRCIAATSDNQDQVGRTANFMIFRPKPTSSDGGEFSRRVMGRTAKAMNVLPQAAPGQRVQINWPAATMQRFWVEFELNENGYTNINGGEIYALGDPEAVAKGFPHDPNFNMAALQQQSPPPIPPQPSHLPAQAAPQPYYPTGQPQAAPPYQQPIGQQPVQQQPYYGSQPGQQPPYQQPMGQPQQQSYPQPGQQQPAPQPQQMMPQQQQPQYQQPPVGYPPQQQQPPVGYPPQQQQQPQTGIRQGGDEFDAI